MRNRNALPSKLGNHAYAGFSNSVDPAAQAPFPLQPHKQRGLAAFQSFHHMVGYINKKEAIRNADRREARKARRAAMVLDAKVEDIWRAIEKARKS